MLQNGPVNLDIQGRKIKQNKPTFVLQEQWDVNTLKKFILKTLISSNQRLKTICVVHVSQLY